ncbi:uncharacterized protein PV09_00642 [Verruconis gallopava]|uniref:AAA+ ATPase domain-containing protein n=1 Tax=Verruconis gallopava TaxID=253628 RepID=A0A0D2AQA6_9PEZI|nr:uncharacterized protein PV09_00642 [Verruconis gallopava]KIW08695.1 hypothetical protein PV09_00642 [Verruconis gallopava]
MDREEIEQSRGEQKQEVELAQHTPDTATMGSEGTAAETSGASESKSKGKCLRKRKLKTKGPGKKSKAKADSSDESSNDDDDSDTVSSESESSDDESSDDDRRSRRKKSSRKMKLKKSSKSSKKIRVSSGSESSDTESSSSESSEEETRRRRRRKKSRRSKSSSSITESDAESEAPVEDAEASPDVSAVTSEQTLVNLATHLGLDHMIRRTSTSLSAPVPPTRSRRSRKHKKDKKKKAKKGTISEFKRVNHVWDNNIHCWKTTEEVEENTDEYDEYAFLVKRLHDWDGHYTRTTVDVKSKQLKEVLMEVMKDVQGETLEAEQPSIDPNMLFNFLEELRTHYKKTLRSRLKKEKRKKARKNLKLMVTHCRLLVKYLDEDYEETKKTLYPLLEAGNITFDLLWALFKPNTLAYTSTYGDHDNPRCFKVDRAIKESSFIKGDWYSIEGRYLEYDGKNYGLGDFEATVEAFKGSRKITSLSVYPLKYHKDPESIKKQLIERGKRFVTMTGQNYRNFKGLAFQKKRKGVAKFNINGRIMIDPATFRRINANYPISLIKPKDDEDEEDDGSDGGSCCGCGSGEESGDEIVQQIGKRHGRDRSGDESRERTKLKIIKDGKGKYHFVNVPVDDDGQEMHQENLDKIASDSDPEARSFTEEELLIASPVVLGFAFQEKTWLEFSLSSVTDIEWNDEAYSSLVLQEEKKQVVKALVSAHKFHGSKTIDDVVQGKGKGLVFVLHGPPGVGKTLTAEGIAEDLRAPLYMVSMGELAMDSSRLESMLQQIMDIAHSWGAVLLLDEADVFLEKRQTQDVHRNALVSIFLRLLEYFQGILFLTTNRVETFDEAFQSRIHVALKYEELSFQASRTVWKEFIEKVRIKEGLQVMPFKNDDLDYLARKKLNGRQIKNLVRIAQALALHEKTGMAMSHVKRVLDVAESFNNDLKGGTGYLDAMRSYT